jgi:superfamily II DNA/RNA helicase
MDQAEMQTLYRKFAAPLAGYAATSRERREGAEFMARTLWTAMIAGPEMEEETWKAFNKHAALDDEALQSIKEMYFEKMKPIVAEEQIVALRQRYRLRKKE